MHLFAIPFWFSFAYVYGVAVVALWKGGWRERAIAFAPALYPMLWRTHGWDGASWRAIVDDSLVLGLCLICAVGAKRYWTLWAASFALLALVSDLLAYAPHVTRWAWASASLIWSYMIDLAVLWGLWTTARDRAQGVAPSPP